MADRRRSALRIGGYTLAGLAIIAAVSHLRRETWSPPAESQMFAPSTGDRTLGVCFLPDGQWMVVRTDPASGAADAEIWEIDGATYGVHYGAGVWNVDGRTDIEYIDGGLKPLTFRYAVTASEYHRDPATNPRRSERSGEMTVLIGDRAIRFEGVDLRQLAHDPARIEEAVAQLEARP